MTERDLCPTCGTELWHGIVGSWCPVCTEDDSYKDPPREFEEDDPTLLIEQEAEYRRMT